MGQGCTLKFAANCRQDLWNRFSVVKSARLADKSAKTGARHGRIPQDRLEWSSMGPGANGNAGGWTNKRALAKNSPMEIFSIAGRCLAITDDQVVLEARTMRLSRIIKTCLYERVSLSYQTGFLTNTENWLRQQKRQRADPSCILPRWRRRSE